MTSILLSDRQSAIIRNRARTQLRSERYSYSSPRYKVRLRRSLTMNTISQPISLEIPGKGTAPNVVPRTE